MNIYLFNLAIFSARLRWVETRELLQCSLKVRDSGARLLLLTNRKSYERTFSCSHVI